MGANQRCARAAWLVAIIALILTSTGTARGQTPMADLAISESAPAQSNAGTDFAVDVTVTNNGPDAAVNVLLSNPTPGGTTFVSATQNSGTTFTCPPPATDTDPINCTCPSLVSGASANFTFVFHIDPGAAAGTYFTDQATVSNETSDPNSENDNGVAVTQTPPPPAADLRVAKTGPGGANPDTDVTYTITLANGGPGDATAVALEDTIPVGMTFVSITQSDGPTFACSGGSGGTITCTLATFAASASASFTVVAHVPSGVSAGTQFVNFATVTSNYDPNSENDQATTLVCIQDDSCQAGPCNGNTAVVCPLPNSCQTQGTCNPVTGACAPNPPKTNGTLCDDTNACTQNDNCQSGQCQGTAINCDDGNPCTADSCDTTTGCLHTVTCEAGIDDASDSGSSVDAPASDVILDGNHDDAPTDGALGTDAQPADVGGTEVGVVDARAERSTEAAADAPSADETVDTARDAVTDVAPRADASTADARGGMADASADVRITDAGGDVTSAEGAPAETPPADTGCSCRIAEQPSSGPPSAWLVLLGILAARRAKRIAAGGGTRRFDRG